MEPRIQYARSSDGVSIAFWSIGQGPPLIHMPAPPASHIQLEWQIPEVRAWYEGLARHHTLIHYDCRGSGLSERACDDYSIASHIRDLEAVVDRLNLPTFALAGGVHAGPVAVAYAASHPDLVSRLVLWCTYGRSADLLATSPQLQAIRALLEMDWLVLTETIANVAFGWTTGEDSRRFAEYLRQCNTQETFRASLASTNEFDVMDLLPQLKMPVLVLHRRQLAYPHVDEARRLASHIPDARLVLLEGSSLAPYLGDTDRVVAEIDGFLNEGLISEPTTASFTAEGTHTIIFTDVEGSTTLTQRLGDAPARDLMRHQESIIRKAIEDNKGWVVKTMGDAFMASFSSATRALDCAVCIQRSLLDYNETAEEPIKVRIGVNVGEPIAEEMDLFGTAVTLASRIASHAVGGQVLVSESVRQIVSGRRFTLSDHGEALLRGFDEPIHLYELDWHG